MSVTGNSLRAGYTKTITSNVLDMNTEHGMKFS
jgi:hypothetical protein